MNKKIIGALIALCLLTLTSFGQTAPGSTVDNPSLAGATFTLTWDTVPAEFKATYRLYDGPTNIAETPEFSFTLANVPIGPHAYTVTAVNIVGESGPSNVLFVLVLTKPPAPGNLKKEKLQALEKKLRVQEKHFVQFKQGTAPDYPQRILGARQILEFSMKRPDATF